MLEFVFIIDQTRGALLVLMTTILVIFALDIPIVLGFSVARYQETGGSPQT
jgi:mannitol-specific phosphotransferase system IIBC component